MKINYSRATPLAEREEPGKTKLINAWSYLLANYKNREGTLRKKYWDAEEIIKQALWIIDGERIDLKLHKPQSIQ